MDRSNVTSAANSDAAACVERSNFTDGNGSAPFNTGTVTIDYIKAVLCPKEESQRRDFFSGRSTQDFSRCDGNFTCRAANKWTGCREAIELLKQLINNL